MTHFLRSFIALAVPDGARDQFAELTRAIARRAVSPAPRLIVADELHVTLKFIGRIERARADAMARALDQVAARRPPIRAEYAELTAFPSPGRARVIVARLSDAQRRLQDLADGVEELSRDFGLPGKARALVPYVSIARLRHSTDVSPWLPPRLDLDEPISLDQLELHGAEPAPPGASIYRVLARVALQPTP